MNLNYQRARDLMVENQLRPNKIKNPLILELFKEMPKENFMLEDEGVIPYSDADITLANNRGYLKNLHIAQLINSAEIQKHHIILHVGALTGYVTALLSNLCLKVYAIETDENLIIKLQENIKKLHLNNIEIVNGSFIYGYKSEELYDIIFIDSPIKKLNENIINQTSSDLGKIIMIKKENDYLSKAIKITKNNNNLSNEYLFDVFSKYELVSEREEFKF